MLGENLMWVAAAIALSACGDSAGGGSEGSETGVGSESGSTTMLATSTTGTTTGTTTVDGSTSTTTTAGTSEGSATESSGSGGTTVGAQPIPDPGDGMDDWFAMGDVSTPATAWPVGVATVSPGYIEAEASATNGNAFWVFEAGAALTEISITAVAFTNPIEFIHLHDGSGGVLGDEITATSNMACCGGAGFAGTWDVTPGNVYVFEVHVPGGALV